MTDDAVAVNATIYGKTIPLLFGSTQILCAPIWASKVTQHDNGTRTVSAFYIAGERAPLTDTVKLNKVLINDSVMYDATQGQAPAIDFTFYNGSDAQVPPPEIVADQGAANTPGFRGRIGIMVRNYVIAVGAKFPEVSIACTQHSTIGDTYYTTPYLTGANVPDYGNPTHIFEMHYDTTTRLLSVMSYEDVLYSFDSNTSTLVAQPTLAHARDYLGSGQSQVRTPGALDPYGRAYVAGFGVDFAATQIRVYDRYSGALLSSYGQDDGSGSGSLGEIEVSYFNCIDTANGTYKTADWWVATSGSFGDIQVFKKGIAGGPITHVQNWPSSYTGYYLTNYATQIYLVNSTYITPNQNIMFGFIMNKNRINQLTQVDGSVAATPANSINIFGPDDAAASTSSIRATAIVDLVKPRKHITFQKTLTAPELAFRVAGGHFHGPYSYNVARDVTLKGYTSCFEVFDISSYLYATVHGVSNVIDEHIVGIWVNSTGAQITILTLVSYTSGPSNIRTLVFDTILSAASGVKFNNDAATSLTDPNMRNGYGGLASPMTEVGGVNYVPNSQLTVCRCDALAPGGLVNQDYLRQVPAGQSKLVYTTDGVTTGFTVLDLTDGTYIQYPQGTYLNVLTNTAYGTGTGLHDGSIYDSDRGYLFYKNSLPDYPGVATLQRDTTVVQTLTLTQLLVELGVLAGFDTSDIVCLNTDDVELVGSIINVQTDFLTLAADICKLFRVDLVESEGKLRFQGPARGTSFTIARTLTDADLAPVNQTDSNDGSLLTKDRTITTDLPQALTVDYLNSDNAYQPDEQIARRTVYPYQAAAGLAVPNISLPVGMSASTALYWVSFALFDTWAEALTLTGLMSRAQLDLEPGDFLELATQNDGTFIVKLTTLTVNADYSMSFTAVTVAQEAPAVDTTNVVGSVVTGSIGTAAVKFNVAYVENIAVVPYNSADFEPDTSYITVISDQVLNVYLYPEDDVYVTGQASGGATFGRILNDHPGVPFVSDDTNTLTVRLLSDTNEIGYSVLDSAYLGGTNVALIGDTGRWELIYYRDVTVNADGTYTISHITRGMRGSDPFVSQQIAGDVFVAIGPSTGFALVPMSPAGTPYFAIAQAILASGAAAGARPAPTTVPVTGGSLKPWAPWHVQAARSGSDVVLTWQRRDRSEDDSDVLGDGGEIVPLSETSEAYDLEIMNTAGTTVVRTVSALTTPTYTYTSAAIDGDELDVSTSITVRVYQLSSVVGRGYTRMTTCPLT